jgi:hypothetical protein
MTAEINETGQNEAKCLVRKTLGVENTYGINGTSVSWRFI